MDWFRIRSFAHSMKYLRKRKSTTHRLNVTHTLTLELFSLPLNENVHFFFTLEKWNNGNYDWIKKNSSFTVNIFNVVSDTHHTNTKFSSFFTLVQLIVCASLPKKPNRKKWYFNFVTFNWTKTKNIQWFSYFLLYFPFWYVVLLIIFTNTALRLPYEIFFCARRSLLEWKTRTNRMRRRREENKKNSNVFPHPILNQARKSERTRTRTRASV